MPKKKLSMEDYFLKETKKKIAKDVKAYNKYAKANNKTTRLAYVEAEVYPEDIIGDFDDQFDEDVVTLPESFNFDKFVVKNYHDGEGGVTGVTLSAPDAKGWFPSSCDYNGS